MKRYFGPAPLVEEHYHIQELIERQEVRSEDRVIDRNRKEELEANAKFIKSEPFQTLKEFYCRQCKEDFVAEVVKEIEEDWNCPGHQIAFYRTKCFKGHWCMRLITDRFLDSYFFFSKRLARDRVLHHSDTIQPHETGFNLLFGKKK